MTGHPHAPQIYQDPELERVPVAPRHRIEKQLALIRQLQKAFSHEPEAVRSEIRIVLDSPEYPAPVEICLGDEPFMSVGMATYGEDELPDAVKYTSRLVIRNYIDGLAWQLETALQVISKGDRDR